MTMTTTLMRSTQTVMNKKGENMSLEKNYYVAYNDEDEDFDEEFEEDEDFDEEYEEDE